MTWRVERAGGEKFVNMGDHFDTGWQLMGVVYGPRGRMGALMRTRIGTYVQVNSNVCQSLPQGEVEKALKVAIEAEQSK